MAKLSNFEKNTRTRSFISENYSLAMQQYMGSIESYDPSIYIDYEKIRNRKPWKKQRKKDNK